MKWFTILKELITWTNGKKSAAATAAFVVAVLPLLFPDAEILKSIDPETLNEIIRTLLEGATGLGILGLLHKLWKLVSEKIEKP